MAPTGFRKKAFDYYLLAVGGVLLVQGNEQIWEEHIVSYYRDADTPNPFRDSELLAEAIAHFQKLGCIEIINDEFAGKMIAITLEGRPLIRELFSVDLPPFNIYNRVSELSIKLWMQRALSSINRLLTTLEPAELSGVAEEPGQGDETPPDEWQPLPLDRNNEKLQNAISSLDAVVEHVKGDNGYAATVPEERSYVLERLSALSEKLKHASSVSIGYIKRSGMDILLMVSKRFREGAVDVTATTARENIIAWIRDHGINLIASLFS